MTAAEQTNALVHELMVANSMGGQFTHDVPDGWPIDAWRLLLETTSEQWDTESLHFWLAGQMLAPDEVVRILAASPLMRVRWRIATKRRLPVDLFAVLAADDDEGVRNAIAQNTKTPRSILLGMRADRAEEVRRLVERRVRKSGP